jgi:hypothetical protein
MMVEELPRPLAKPERPFVAPILAGDVLCWIRPETYAEGAWGTRAKQSAFRHSSFVALAAFARVGMSAAVRMRVRHWMPGGEEIVIIHDPLPRPVPVLPLLRHTIEAYLAVRPDAKDGEDWLFVNRFGNPCTVASFLRQMSVMGNLLGVRSDVMAKSFMVFFDRCFEKESDRTSVIALRGRASEVFDDPVRADKVCSIGRLREVLRRNHPLAGPIEAYQGIRGRRLLAKLPHNLPRPPSKARLKPGPAMATDPVVLSLLKLPRPDNTAEREALSQTLRERHFVHLDDLRKIGELRLREMAYLLQTTVARANTWRLRRQAHPDLPQRDMHTGRRYKKIDTFWKSKLVSEFRKRPAGETNWAFCQRMKLDGFPHAVNTAFKFLRRVGEIRRLRGRPRRRRRAAA